MSRHADTSGSWPRVVGRYELHEPFASGGMASVHFGRLRGDAGFSRPVALKRLHPQLANDPDFVTMFLDEARLASRVRHPCVVAVHDVVSAEGELFLVMDYVAGETLARLLRVASSVRRRVPEEIASRVFVDALAGLHAAHEARDEAGASLDIVHRDVSPQNVLLGVDGITRILDFGIAKATGRLRTTRGAELKGKLAYMAPEQIRGERASRLVDVYAAGVTLWEALTGARLFEAENDAALMIRVLQGHVEDPRVHVPDLTPALATVVLRALSADPSRRHPSAEAMAHAIAAAVPPAPHGEVSAWVRSIARDTLDARERTIAAIVQSRRPAHVSTPSAEEPRTVAASPAARTRRGRAFVLVAIVAVGTSLVVGGALAARSHLARSNAPSFEAQATAPRASTPPSSEAVPAPPSAAPLVAAIASSPPAPPPVRPVPRPVAPRATAPPPSCDPPFYVDANGVRRYKAECLR